MSENVTEKEIEKARDEWRAAHEITNIVVRSLTLGTGGEFRLGECQKEIINHIARIRSEAVQAEREKRYCIEQDGDQWLATAPGFIDLQNSSYIAAAYGKSPVEAINNLLSRRKEFPKLTWEETEKIYDIVDRIRDERTLAMGSEEFELSSHEAMGLLSTAMVAFASYQSPGKDIIRKAAVLLGCVPRDSDFGKVCHEVAAILSSDKEPTNG